MLTAGGDAPDVAPLRTETVRDAVVFPVRWDESKEHFVGGVTRARSFGLRQEPVDQLYLRTFKFDVVPPTRDVGSVWRRKAGPAIYAGMLRDNYGHFLLESCARLWFAAREPGLPIVFVNAGALWPYQAAVLSLLGIKNEIVFVNKPTRFNQLILPQPGFRIDDFFHPAQARFLAQFDGWADDPDRPVWFSRTGLPDRHGGVVEECEIEQRLQAAGWRLVHPETLDICEQLRAIQGIRHLAGVAGSALHSVILMRHPPRQLTVFPRGPRRPELLRMISAGCGIHQVNLEVRTKFFDGVGSQVRWQILNPTLAADALIEADMAARERWPDGSRERYR